MAANYGIRTLCYGTLLPGPNIGIHARSTMRAAKDAGFEVGVHCYNHVLWQDCVRDRDYAWTRRQMQLAIESFRHVFNTDPEVHGAAGWQLNEHVPALEAELNFRYASDTRGESPFMPVINAAHGRCPQLPTTLPTFDELIGVDGCTEGNVADAVLQRSLSPASCGHVFTLHAELEGIRLLPQFERLLQHWIDHSLQPCSLREFHARLTQAPAPHAVIFREVAGRAGPLACQGKAL